VTNLILTAPRGAPVGAKGNITPTRHVASKSGDEESDSELIEEHVEELSISWEESGFLTVPSGSRAVGIYRLINGSGFTNHSNDNHHRQPNDDHLS
jgi:hypothetical protein